MKKSMYPNALVLAILALLISGSCSDDFLDVPVQGAPTTESDPNLASKLVTGVYNSLLQGDSWGKGDVHGFAFIAVTSIMSDDADKGSTSSDQAVPVGDIDNFTLTPTNKFAETLWSGHYNSIGAANQALAALEVAPLSDELRNKFIAEVRFLRGYIYFNLVRMYGGVPLVTRVPRDADDANSDPAFKTRATVDETYDLIVSDLQFAVDNLKVRSEAETGHADKGAAQAMLAKVLMYRGGENWNMVYTLTEEVINSGEYELLPEYETIWRQEGDNSTESVFEIQTGEFNNANLRVDNYTAPQGARGRGGWDDLGWGFNNPSASLINAYEPNDKRKAATIIFIDNTGTYSGTRLWDGFRIPSSDSVQNLYYNYKAYTSKTAEEYAKPDEKDRPKNIKILRYADVLLMNAEAGVITAQGDPASRINDLRARAGLTDKATVTLEDVRHERRIELAMEHDRFWDLVRQGNAEEVMHAAGKTNFVSGKHELLPIPNNQVLLSGGALEQNNY